MYYISNVKKIPANLNEKELLKKYYGKYQPELTQKLDRLEDKTFVQEIINEIVLWKVNRYASISDDLLIQIEELKTVSQGNHRYCHSVLKKLLEKKGNGVDLPLASTILRFRNPDTFQIIDRHAYRALFGKKYALYHSTNPDEKIKVYFDYLDGLIELCNKSGYHFRTNDRVLYEFDKENNGKL